MAPHTEASRHQYADTKHLCQRVNIDFRHHMENPVFPKQPVCQQHMNMRMPAGIVTEGPESRKLAYLNSHHGTQSTFFQAGRFTKELKQAFIHTFTELA